MSIFEQETYYPNDIHSLHFSMEKEGKTVSEISIGLYDHQPSMHMGTTDGIMLAYKELSLYSPRYPRHYSPEKEKNEKNGKQLMLAFLDTYVFNTPESREVLQEIMNQPTQEEKKHLERKNDEIQRNIAKTIQSEAEEQREAEWKKREKEKSALISSVNKDILRNQTHSF